MAKPKAVVKQKRAPAAPETNENYGQIKAKLLAGAVSRKKSGKMRMSDLAVGKKRKSPMKNVE